MISSGGMCKELHIPPLFMFFMGRLHLKKMKNDWALKMRAFCTAKGERAVKTGDFRQQKRILKALSILYNQDVNVRWNIGKIDGSLTHGIALKVICLANEVGECDRKSTV